MDPEVIERGLRSHAVTQNAVANYLRTRGIEPRSPGPDDPEFDLAWEYDGKVFVAEVKSLTTVNEEKQLRLALGQVLRYRQQLGRPGQTVVAVVVAEREPRDPTWSTLCAELAVKLVWPESLGALATQT